MTSRQSSGGDGGTDQPTTLTCDECGTRYEPGQSFCEGCNAVLRWTPDRPPTHPERRPAPSTDPGPPPPGAGDTTPHPAGGPTPHTAQAAGQPGDRAPAWHPAASATGARPDQDPASRPGGAPAPWPQSTPSGGAPGPHHPATGGTQAPRGSAQPGSTAQTTPAGATGGAHPATPGRPDTANADDWPRTGEPAGATDPTRPVPRATPQGTPTPSSAPPQGPSPHGAQGPPAPESNTDRVRALLIPVAEPQGEPERPPSVVPVLPGRPAPARPEVRAPVTPENHGGIACPWCHTANRPDRHFCARCAMPMAEGPENPTRLPWWRRMFDYRNREQPWAGDRPRLRYQIGRILRWVVLATVVALVGWALFQTPTAVSAVRDHFAKRAPLAPDSYKASRSFPEHGPDKAFDVVSNSWWGPGVTQSAQGEWLEARFRDPVRLLDIGITPGMSGHGDTLTKSALPHRIEARITTDDGKTTTREINLDQGAGFQRRPFRAQNVTAVRFTIQSAYGADNKKQMAIAEIEFFGPSKASRS
ncbi:NADase-type glycan-binding domain-containing protein [Streptomyces sp. NPDC021098]|uniref:NADase-type glycan-binding domain-containing protein n=1 Tax=unclassified Streptomyces TaxID=2593676 RepID=UPI00379394AF